MPVTGEESLLFLGASRGLGHEVRRQLSASHPQLRTASWSRRSEPSFDFSKPEQWSLLAEKIRQLEPRRLWFFAGGGPFGEFRGKEWKDHQWAFRVNFECPAFLLHHFLREPLPGLEQMIFVGSAVAENAPDPLAASYSAAKHALRGLITSVQSEDEGRGALDLRLFSPTYIDTPLLPKSAKPRQVPGKLRPVGEVAREFIEWAMQTSQSGRNFSHAEPRC